MERLYRLFQKAAVLGSLINPRAGEGDLLVAAFHELQPLLEKALAQETKDDNAHEMAVTARGLAKAAQILAGQFTLVATNVPYLGRGKQSARSNPNAPEELADYCERVHPEAKADLATCFVERCLEFCARGSSTALVTPQNWLFLGTYSALRANLLRGRIWNIVGKLGPGAFETIGGEVVNVALLAISNTSPEGGSCIAGLDATSASAPSEKAKFLLGNAVEVVTQAGQLRNPDARVIFEEPSEGERLEKYAYSYEGLTTGDLDRFVLKFWETRLGHPWRPYIQNADHSVLYSGRTDVIRWGTDGEIVASSPTSYVKGKQAWGKLGIRLTQMSSLPATLYAGELFGKSAATIVPNNPAYLPAIWCFCSSPEFSRLVRIIDPKLNVTVATLVKVPFDLAHWQKVAAEKYPHGLPKPFSSDPTQWLFNGHPAGADQPLHVAVARLLGYQWPRQTGSSFPDSPAIGEDGLEKLADSDGIVCLSATKGEAPAAERLRELLAHAYGKDWSAQVLEGLLTQVEYGGDSLEDWLRNGFFEQHCALFHNRPFVWHIWDGLKNGFSALVNYHKLTHANLEKLTYAYLGDWIRRQQAAVEAEEAGSDARLQAAKGLQGTLKLILEGEPPYDIFVRWKPLAQQSIGWHPDLNDGVRLNIRPFATADILRKRVKVKWDKDRGKEPQRAKEEYPWFWCAGEPGTDPRPGQAFAGDRWNDVHLTKALKEKARK
jgi:hypothetical protein